MQVAAVDDFGFSPHPFREVDLDIALCHRPHPLAGNVRQVDISRCIGGDFALPPAHVNVPFGVGPNGFPSHILQMDIAFGVD